MEYSAFEKVPQKAKTFSLRDEFVFWFSSVHFQLSRLTGFLISGVIIYWVLAYGFLSLRESFTAAIPTALFVGITYLLIERRRLWLKKR